MTREANASEQILPIDGLNKISAACGLLAAQFCRRRRLDHRPDQDQRAGKTTCSI